MLKSTIALLAVLFASAASQSSDGNNGRRKIAEEYLNDALAQSNDALNANIGSIASKIPVLENAASELFQPLYEDIIQETTKSTGGDGTTCANLLRELNSVINETFANSNKCIAEAIAKTQSDSIRQRKLEEVTKTVDELKVKLSKCGSDSMGILCIADISGDAIALPIFLKTWISNNPENIDQVLIDFKTSLETCWAKEAPVNFIGKIQSAANDLESCLSKLKNSK